MRNVNQRNFASVQDYAASTASRPKPQPREGLDFCACGSKYWDGNVCHSCGDRFRPEVAA